MAALKDWLMSLIAVSVLCAAADSLMPSGSVKQVGKLVCGLVLLCAMLRPVSALREISITQVLEGYTAQLHRQEEQLEQQTRQTRKTVIEEHFASYITDKAAQLGVVCKVEVDCVMQEDGLYLPESVRLWGDFTDVQQSRLSELIGVELDVPTRRQTYYLTKEAGA